jgi:hypothetical protein
MANRDDNPKPVPQGTNDVAALAARVDQLERELASVRNARGVDRAGAPEGAGLDYHIDRLNAMARKFHYGEMLDYDRNARFYLGHVTSGQPEGIGPNPPPADEQPRTEPFEPKVTVRGDQVTPPGESAGALDASRPTV